MVGMSCNASAKVRLELAAIIAYSPCQTRSTTHYADVNKLRDSDVYLSVLKIFQAEQITRDSTLTRICTANTAEGRQRRDPE